MQTVTPYLLYQDAAAAIDWLTAAFGLRERLRYVDENGDVTHAELTVGDGEVFLGDPGPDYRNPRELQAFTHLVHVVVEDVDSHYTRAVAAGAAIQREPYDTPYGHRRYDALDLESHWWSFATVLREVAPEEWGATKAQPLDPGL